MNKVKDYIVNKRNQERLTSCLSVLFWIINFTFVQICINMFLKIISAGKSDWLNRGLKMELTNDPFIILRTEFIMRMLIMILIIIIVFSVASIVFFRNVQLKNFLSQIGMYRVLGYNRRKLLDICMLEPLADMIIAFPVSMILSVVLWNMLSKIEMVSFMMAMMDDSIWLDVSAFIMCGGVMVLVTIVHTKIFMERSLKKGIPYMLGQGVV